METQGYLCDIQTKKMETHMCDIYTKITEGTHRKFVWHSYKEKWDSSTQKKDKKVWQFIQNKVNVWNKRKQGDL